MAINNRLLDYATWRRSPSLFSPNLRTAKHRPVHADPADLKRFQEIKRVTADEEFGGWTQATHFGKGSVLDPLHGANRDPPMTRHIIRWIAWAQLAMGALLLGSALGDAPIPVVLTLP